MANQFSIDVDQSNDGIKVVSVPKTWLEGGNTPNWITPVVNYGMTSGGILIPQRVDSEGRPEITQYGSNVEKIKVDTIVNATSVQPNGDVTAGMNITNEDEIWAAISIDQQPWTLFSGVPWYLNSDYGIAEVCYPPRTRESNTYGIAKPAISLLLFNDPLLSNETINSFEEAREIALPPMPGTNIRVKNFSDNIATVTVKLIRVWRNL